MGHLQTLALVYIGQVQDSGSSHVLIWHPFQKISFPIYRFTLNDKTQVQALYLDRKHLLSPCPVNIFHFLSAMIDNRIFHFRRTRINYILTPGPGTFKPFGSFNLEYILILCLDLSIFPSYDPGPGTLLKSYLNF